MLWFGIIRSVEKSHYRKGKGWGVEYRRVYCVAQTFEEAGARLACRTPGGWQLRAIHLVNPGKVPERLEDVLEVWELEELERDMVLPGRTLHST